MSEIPKKEIEEKKKKVVKKHQPGPEAGYPEDHEERNRARSEAVRELMTASGPELSLKTETAPGMVVGFAILRTVREGLTLGRERRLSDIYTEELDRRMISKGRKNRGEIITVMSAGKGEEEEEFRV